MGPGVFHGKWIFLEKLYTADSDRLCVISGPSSQKSSRTNSPAILNQNLDALEGQFKGTPGNHCVGELSKGDKCLGVGVYLSPIRVVNRNTG